MVCKLYLNKTVLKNNFKTTSKNNFICMCMGVYFSSQYINQVILYNIFSFYYNALLYSGLYWTKREILIS